MKLMKWFGALLLVSLGASVQAQEIFPIVGTSASGRPGDRVFVDLAFDYGAGLGVTVEDLQFEYQFAGITFILAASTIGPAGGPQGLVPYTDALRTFAQAHSGSVLVNAAAPGSQAGYTGYALSFYTLDDTPHMRTGTIHLRLAFDILPTAPLGFYGVPFGDRNFLGNVVGDEWSYPTELRNLGVLVVPEPQIALMLLPGLALVLFGARRRGQPRR